MKIAVIGFHSAERCKAAIEEFVEENQIYLFSIVTVAGGVAERIARSMGAPVIYFTKTDPEWLLWYLPKEADYLIAEYDGENSLTRRLIMNFKAVGKHGKIKKI